MGNPEVEVDLQAYQLLLDARDLVIRGRSHGAHARDGEGRAVGRAVDPSHPSARSWSLAGALEAASADEVDGPSRQTEEARARAIAAAALVAAIRGDENEALRQLEGAIRELAARQGRTFDAAEVKANGQTTAVRCLRCGTPYTKQARHEILEAAQGCPSCGYQGWSFAKEEPHDRKNSD
jgi:rubrerythrin